MEATDVAKPENSLVMTGTLTPEQRRERLLAFLNAPPEVQEATRRAEAVHLAELCSDPFADELDDATAKGDGERVRAKLAERQWERQRLHARTVAAERELHALRVRAMIATATRPLTPLLPRRTPVAGTARPAGRPARRPSGTRAVDGDDGPAEPPAGLGARTSLRDRLAAALAAFRSGGRA